MSALTVPLLLLGVGLWGAYKGVDIFSAMIKGAREGLNVAAGILPSLCVVLTAVYMLRASGAMEALAELLAPLLSRLGIAPQCAPLLLLRPVSGSGALAAASEIMETHGPDSYVGRCAAVMLGSTETTFYVIAVYFAAGGIKKIRHAIPAALLADLVGFIMAGISVRLLF